MKSIELFSGAGGLALGLEAAGFKHVALVERDKDACTTLRLNRPNWNLIESDVRKVDFSALGTVDLVAGGPPCQPFSIGGKSLGYDDSRDMFPQAVRAVRELRPKAFIFENVRGLLRKAFHGYVEHVRLQLAQGYQVSIHLADAADYGVPQRRQRVFFVGFRSDLNVTWNFPAPLASSDELLRQKYVTGEYWKEHGIAPRHNAVIRSLKTTSLKRWKTVRDALSGLPHPKEGGHANHSYQPGAKSYPGHTGSPWDEPAKALKAGDHGVPGGENMLDYGNGKVCYFSVRESARIQTFPDEYVFSGSWTESMRQLGNAVPVALAQVVATSIFNELCHTK